MNAAKQFPVDTRAYLSVISNAGSMHISPHVMGTTVVSVSHDEKVIAIIILIEENQPAHNDPLAHRQDMKMN